jgi:hypothetical protein
MVGGEHLQERERERERIWKKHLLEVDCFNLKLLWIFFFFFFFGCCGKKDFGQ